MEFKIGDRVKLKNSISNQIGEIIGVFDENLYILNMKNERFKHASKNDFLVQFPYEVEFNDYSFYKSTELIKV